jgi:prolyl-tRNA synthetase
VQSYRDLPLLINQWANVVRWELRTRLFLRTSEFLWQEGHTAHATEAEAREETRLMLETYATFAEQFMAMPVLKGPKTASERFPGAVDTFAIEAMMQDRKALQAGTSHFLGQNFAKASGIRFQSQAATEEYAWTTSWGVSTRLIGGLLMTHSDDDGLVLPPRLAPAHIVLLPVFRNDETKGAVLESVHALAKELRGLTVMGRQLEVEVDARDIRGGDKMWEWVKKGVPLRLEIGPRDVESGTVVLSRRDKSPREKETINRSEIAARLPGILEDIQSGLHARARDFRDANTVPIDDRRDLQKFFDKKGGGFALVHWDGTAETEAKFKEDLKATIRCVAEPPSHNPAWVESMMSPGKCIITGNPSPRRVVLARSY